MESIQRRPMGAIDKEKLTKREMEVCKRLSIGMTTREVAMDLKISMKTVESHRAAIFWKLGTTNNVKLARYALRMDWVSLESDLFTVE